MAEPSHNRSFPPGHLVAGRYELAELLGEGGHGAVYRALQRPLGREVAIKMILAEAVFSDGMLERFTREAALVQRLEHPNTVRLYDFGATEQGLPFIVFELLRGRTLEQEIARGPLTPARVGRVASQVLKSLMEAHALGIVHRDIKPSNILLADYSGETDFVKVLDFGVARHTAPGASGDPITRAGQIVGTPSYMAPEQIHGAALGPGADLYALGLVMAEAASGIRVYDDGSAMQIWMRQTSPEPVPLPGIVLSSALGPIIARATRKNVAERYASAREMLADVERALLAGGGETDPLAKPLVVNVPRATGPAPSPFAVTAAPPYERPPSIPSSQPSQPSQPSRPTQPSPATGTSAAIVILGVVAILSLLIAAGAGAALYLSRKPATGVDTKAHASLAGVTPERCEKRLRSAGWTIVPTSPSTVIQGYKGTYITATRGAQSALVHLYEYDSPAAAAQTETILRMTEGPVIARDGGRVFYVFVAQDPAKSRPLFDELVR